MKWSGWRWLIDDGRERGRVDVSEQPGQRSLAEIEQEMGLSVRDEVAGAGGTFAVRVRGPRAEDGQPHASSLMRIGRGYRLRPSPG